MKKVFASRLLSLCKGRSIAECAREWGITQASLDRYVKAQRTPTGDSIVEICKATGVSADWLLGLSSTSVPSAPSIPAAQPDAASASSEAYWRDLAASQQKTISSLTQLLTAAQKPIVPARTGGRAATKTA